VSYTPNRPFPEIVPLKRVRMEDGTEGFVTLVEFFRGYWGADIVVPGKAGRRWGALESLTLIEG
jgi:hypothetical protein